MNQQDPLVSKAFYLLITPSENVICSNNTLVFFRKDQHVKKSLQEGSITSELTQAAPPLKGGRENSSELTLEKPMNFETLPMKQCMASRTGYYLCTSPHSVGWRGSATEIGLFPCVPGIKQSSPSQS